MSEASPQQVLARLQETYERVAVSPLTGDASLDVFLLLLTDEDRRWALDLSVPHWFNVELASALAEHAGQDAAALEPRVRQLPFVRPHPRGLAYHDAARDGMRGFLLRSDPSRVRDVCRRLSDVLDGLAAGGASQEEIRRERIYSRLAHDESAGLADLVRAFNEARKGMRRAACDQLLSLAEEQHALLGEPTRNHLRLLRAKLAFDQHQNPQARSLLESLPSALPAELAEQVVLLQGRILEAEEQWEEAEEHYRAAVENICRGAPPRRAYLARLYHRRGAANLGLMNLEAAERYARSSLELNTESGDDVGVGLNLGLLGQIHDRLGEWKDAREYFEKSLAKLDMVKNQGDRLLVLTNLARLYQGRRDFTQAEKYYRAAIDERSAAGDTYGLGVLYSDLGWLELLRGRTSEAVAHWEASCKSFRTMREPTRAAEVLHLVAKSLSGRGDFDGAVARQQEAIRLLPADSDLRPGFGDELERLTKEAGRSRSWWWRKGRRYALATFVLLVLASMITLALSDAWR